MGQKVHPTGIRLGIVKRHSSVWYAGKKEYADKLNTDLRVRKFVKDKLSHASVSRVDIERPANTARITIHTARPGIVIGKSTSSYFASRYRLLNRRSSNNLRHHWRKSLDLQR